jgi:ATP-dependent Clp protease ATP-binding subunit ClpB
MTSNIGSPLLLEGVSARGEIEPVVRDAVWKELRAHFRPEFLNRVDDTILFKPLQLDEIKQIVTLLAANLRARLAERKVGLELTEAGIDLIARAGFDPVFGARPLRRFIQREVETRLARADRRHRVGGIRGSGRREERSARRRDRIGQGQGGLS